MSFLVEDFESLFMFLAQLKSKCSLLNAPEDEGMGSREERIRSTGNGKALLRNEGTKKEVEKVVVII